MRQAGNPRLDLRSAANPLVWANSMSGAFPALAPSVPLATTTTRPLAAMESVRRVAVIDPFEGGHHFPWMVDFCLSFLETGVEVTALCPDPDRLRSEIIRRAPADAAAFDAVSSEGMVDSCAAVPVSRRLFVAARNWLRIQRRLDYLPRALKPDAVFFAYIDGMLTRGMPPFFVDRLFSYRWSALYMSPTWMRHGRQVWPKLESSVAWSLRAENCESIAVIDEGLVERFSELFPGKVVVHLPDFLPGSAESIRPGTSEEIIARARGRCVVGVVGSLQSRKGITALLKLALEEPDGPFFYVFAGQFVPNAFTYEERALWKAVIAKAPENCYIRATAIESEEEYVAIANSCDIFYAAYLRFPNSSNALAWAAWLRKPIIVSEGHLMEERVRRYRLGAAIPENNRHACRIVLEEIRRQLKEKKNRDHGFSQYLKDHSRHQLTLGIRRLTHRFAL